MIINQNLNGKNLKKIVVVYFFGQENNLALTRFIFMIKISLIIYNFDLFLGCINVLNQNNKSANTNIINLNNLDEYSKLKTSIIVMNIVAI